MYTLINLPAAEFMLCLFEKLVPLLECPLKVERMLGISVSPVYFNRLSYFRISGFPCFDQPVFTLSIITYIVFGPGRRKAEMANLTLQYTSTDRV